MPAGTVTDNFERTAIHTLPRATAVMSPDIYHRTLYAHAGLPVQSDLYVGGTIHKPDIRNTTNIPMVGKIHDATP